MFPSTRKVTLNRTKLKDTTCPNPMPPRRLKKPSEVGRDRTFHIMEPSSGPQQAEETARCSPGFCHNRGRSSDQNINPIPTSPAGSEASLKKIVRSSACELCGDCKIISPRRRRTLVRQGPQKLAPCSEQHKSIQTRKKVLDLTVNLCDVVRMSGARCYDCGFVLPHDLETETVYCFKEDITAAGLQLRSCCSGHQKDGSDEHQRVESDPGTSCDTIGTEISGGKTYHNNTEFLTHRATPRVTPDVETKNPNCLSNEQTPCGTSNSPSQPRPEFTVGMCNEVGDGPEMCAMPEETPGLMDDDPGSLTCQRVRLYVWKRRSSCARTYIVWHNKQLVVSGFMKPDTHTSDFAQTEEIPPVSHTPREPSPSFDTSGDAGDRVDSGRVEETDEKATGVRGNAQQLESEQTMSTDRPPDAAECGPPLGSSDHDDDESFNGECRSPSPSDPGSPGSPPSELADGERRPTQSGTGGGAHLGVLDEFTAYQRDILLVDVDRDDSELFDGVPQESLLKLGPNRAHENPKTLTTYGASQTFKQSWTPVNINRPCDSSDNEENPSRPWRPKKSDASPKSQSNLLGEENGTEPTVLEQGTSYAGRDHISGDIQERNAQVEAESEWRHPVPPLGPVWKGPSMPNTANKCDPRCPKINFYCSVFFGGSLSCNDNICRFLHVPMKGDEKFCVNTVSRFTKNPVCLQKAGDLFASYYQHNPPGMFFSVPVFLSLLWTLLKADLVPDVLSVLSVALAHKIVPTHEFLLALFTCVREKGFASGVPRLMQLTYKMASENLMLSLDCFDGIENIPEYQQIIDPNVPDTRRPSVSDGVPISCSLILAHVIVEMELCTEQENWRCLGKAFRSICTPCQHPSQVERISGNVAVALLSKTRDKLSVPFVAFAETICPTEDPNSPLMGFIGRIGVSLMQRYHKTQQWAKGRRLMEALTRFKINYSMQRGLFVNEDGSSRCNLITLAAELFLLGGSVEGALRTLRESKWFVSSNVWPCKQPDLERRSRVLAHLAEKASHRDALEVLRNLPGIQKPNDQVDISKYTPLFNTHLQVCVDRLVLPVASDLAYLMLSRKVPVDGAVLRALLHKLGKQNHWQRARELFRHSLTAGHYPAVSAPAGFMSLIVPSQLGEVELSLTFEMLITVNASFILPLPEMTTTTLNIILKRSQESEREYLSAGSRLLLAALIPQPNLEVHYTTVNSSREQVFTLSVASALRWLRRNHTWANKMWS
ncbi:uncharacterized protein topaz1 isoform X1 [Hippocampus comes]|uniref:uncharacterized protein topaz1 isoform X1 n=1 Tax=Hippocampus comes TaxID=109280 RepID=UPI00094E8C20|nr:PREDICTED: testis- and ovary-specific PAZ domain-containing protein 1 isoform X1 [Hippocampus comes]